MKSVAAALVAVAAFAAYAALVGWLKTLYFLRPFGLSPSVIQSGRSDVLFESWYVLQNLTYFALIVWLALQTRRRFFVAVAVAYALIPTATHYAFLLYEHRLVRVVVDHQHSWLKIVPFALLAITVFHGLRGRRIDWRWRYGTSGLVLMVLLVGSWGISAAKHFGSYDAERILHRPTERLPRVSLTWRDPPPPDWVDGEPLFLLHLDPARVVAVEFDQTPPWLRHRPVVHTMDRTDLRHFAVLSQTAVQPGGQYF